VNKSISIQNGVDSKWVTGDVVGFDGILHTGKHDRLVWWLQLNTAQSVQHSCRHSPPSI
jgi:hypothetical protein